MSDPEATTAGANTPEAQLDFVKLMVAAAEGHLRAFDTKAQIALAAFLISWNPLLAMLHSACREGLATWPAVGLAVAVVVAVAAYGRAVWPSQARLRGDASADLFFLTRGATRTSSSLMQRLAMASYVEELAGEAIKLSDLRQRKTAWLKVALGCSLAAYVVFVALLGSRLPCA